MAKKPPLKEPIYAIPFYAFIDAFRSDPDRQRNL
jgi:hypothetical protein